MKTKLSDYLTEWLEFHQIQEQRDLQAVKQSGWALQFVKVQTEEICLAAVKQCGLALQYVKIQTEEICLEAVKRNVLALKYVEKRFME